MKRYALIPIKVDNLTEELFNSSSTGKVYYKNTANSSDDFVLCRHWKTFVSKSKVRTNVWWIEVEVKNVAQFIEQHYSKDSKYFLYTDSLKYWQKEGSSNNWRPNQDDVTPYETVEEAQAKIDSYYGRTMRQVYVVDENCERVQMWLLKSTSSDEYFTEYVSERTGVRWYPNESSAQQFVSEQAALARKAEIWTNDEMPDIIAIPQVYKYR